MQLNCVIYYWVLQVVILAVGTQKYESHIRVLTKRVDV